VPSRVPGRVTGNGAPTKTLVIPARTGRNLDGTGLPGKTRR